MSRIKAKLEQLARDANGSFKTISDRIKKVNLFDSYLSDNNIQIKRVEHIKTKHIEGFIQSRLAKGISKRALQNDMSALRVILTQAGREKLATSERLSSKSLHIDNASRQGTKTAINDEQFQAVIDKALKANKESIVAGLRLCRYLGLRGAEAVRCTQSLKTWQKDINEGKETLRIVFGTKGKRPRDTRIINREKVKQAIDYAIAITEKQNGRLIDKPNLKEAMTYWRNQTARLGLKGEIAPHSLRYAFTHESVDYYLSKDYTDKEALAMTSMDLGHGDGRGRYVKRVYSL